MTNEGFKAVILREFPLVEWEFSHPKDSTAKSEGVEIRYYNVGWDVFTIEIRPEGVPSIYFQTSSAAEARLKLEALADLTTKLTTKT